MHGEKSLSEIAGVSALTIVSLSGSQNLKQRVCKLRFPVFVYFNESLFWAVLRFVRKPKSIVEGLVGAPFITGATASATAAAVTAAAVTAAAATTAFAVFPAPGVEDDSGHGLEFVLGGVISGEEGFSADGVDQRSLILRGRKESGERNVKKRRNKQNNRKTGEEKIVQNKARYAA